MLNARNFIQAQKEVLEGLFGADWFESHQSHPAFERWLLCNELLDRGGRIDLTDNARLVRLAEIVLDNYSIVQATGGHIDRYILGDLANYGDKPVQSRIRAVIHEPRQFLDVLVELNYAAWHLSGGNQVRAFETAGYPDFEIIIPSPPANVATDCKRVQARTSYNRFRKLVNKANKQIKKLGDSYHGLVLVDVSERIPLMIQFEGYPPPEIDRITVILRRTMDRDHTALSGALINWRDAVIMPMTDGSRGTLCLLRQHSRLVRHSKPLRELPQDDSLFRIEYTIALRIKPA